jgi:hypothetical protein
MRKVFLFINIFVVIIISCSCVNNTAKSTYDFNARDYVDLVNYNNLKLDKDYTEIEDDDVESIINMDLSSSEKYIKTSKNKGKDNDIAYIKLKSSSQGTQEKVFYIIGSNEYSEDFDKILKTISVKETKTINHTISKEITINEVQLLGIYRNATCEDINSVLEYYKKDNIKDVYKYVRKRARKEIIYNYAFNYITENSTINNYPEQIKNKIDEDIENAIAGVENENTTLSDYLEKNKTTYDEFVSPIYSYYSEAIIAKAILEKEDKTIGEDELKKEENGEETTDEIYYNLLFEKLRKILISKVKINK